MSYLTLIPDKGPPERAGGAAPTNGRRRPIEERFGDDFTFVWPATGPRIEVKNTRPAFNAFTRVAARIEARDTTGGSIDFDDFTLSEAAKRHQFAKSCALKTETDPVLWQQVVYHACRTTIERYLVGSQSIDLAHHVAPPSRHAIRDIVPLGETSVIYGDGASLKSFTVEAMLLSIALGRKIGPFEPLVQGPVVLVDWEATEDEHQDGAAYTRCRWGMRINTARQEALGAGVAGRGR